MMFHNELFDMSTTTTPAQPAIPTPSVDNRNSWPQTPAHQGQDSRRPSWAPSVVSDASGSGPSSTYSYSQPATPVQSVHHQNESFTHQWSDHDHDDGKGIISSSIPEGCTMDALNSQMFTGTFGHPLSAVESMSAYQSTSHAHVGDAFAMPHLSSHSSMGDAWTAQDAPMSFNVNLSMETNVIHSVHELPDESISSSMYVHPSTSMLSNLEPLPFQTYGAEAAPMYPPAQVVVPSQINPHDDCHMEDYPDYGSPNDATTEAYSQGFASGSTDYNSWVDVPYPSPDAAHFCHEEGEEDYISVKQEVSTFSPSHISSTPRSRLYSGSDMTPRTAVTRVFKPSRRKSTSIKNESWQKYQAWGVEVAYKGPRWVDTPDGRKTLAESRAHKPQVCTYVDADGHRCGGRFLRNEHLKRHQQRHTGERHFPCPLDQCGRRIGRSDNANDHFKTHLRGNKPKKRNLHCTFATLEMAIHASAEYDSKKAEKITSKLRAWYQKEMVKMEGWDVVETKPPRAPRAAKKRASKL